MKEKNKTRKNIFIGLILIIAFVAILVFGLQQTIYGVNTYPSTIVSIGNVGTYGCGNTQYASPNWIGWNNLVIAYKVTSATQFDSLFDANWGDWRSTTNRGVSDTQFILVEGEGVIPQTSCDGTIKNCDYAGNIEWDYNSELDLCFIMQEDNFPIGINPPDVYGCTDLNANNYLDGATIDDGSCNYDPPIYVDILGCMDISASNYDSTATVDDGSCEFEIIITDIYGCKDSTANNYNPIATIDDGSCKYEISDDVFGCKESTANNYNPSATISDGSCTYGEVIKDAKINLWIIILVLLIAIISISIYFVAKKNKKKRKNGQKNY